MKLLILRFMFMVFFTFVPLKAWAVKIFGPTGNLTYDTTFNALFKKEHNLVPWVKEYLQTQNGVGGGPEKRMIGDKTYELHTICKPHDCPENVIFVFFEPGGTHAWALLINDKDVLRFSVILIWKCSRHSKLKRISYYLNLMLERLCLE